MVRALFALAAVALLIAVFAPEWIPPIKAAIEGFVATVVQPAIAAWTH